MRIIYVLLAFSTKTLAQWVGDEIYDGNDCSGTPIYVEMNKANSSDPDNRCPATRDQCTDFQVSNATWHGIQICGAARPQTFLPNEVDAGTQLLYAARFADANCSQLASTASNYMYKSGSCIPFGVGYATPDYKDWEIPNGIVGAYQVTCLSPKAGSTGVEVLWLDNDCKIPNPNYTINNTDILFDGYKCNAIPFGDGEWMYMRGSCFGQYSAAIRLLPSFILLLVLL